MAKNGGEMMMLRMLGMDSPRFRKENNRAACVRGGVRRAW